MKEQNEESEEKKQMTVSTPYGQGIVIDSSSDGKFLTVLLETMLASVAKKRCKVIESEMEIDPNALKMRVCPLSLYDFPYAVGQGALAIMCRQQDIEQKNEI